MVSGTIISMLMALGCIFGVGSLIAAIVLLAAKTVKGTTFWAGLLTIIIAAVVTAIITVILTMSGVLPQDYADSKLWTSIISGTTMVIYVLSMFIAENSVIKNKSCKGAISFASGLNVFSLFSIGISMFSLYSVAVNTNSGMYAELVKQKLLTEEAAATVINTVTSLTVVSTLMMVVSAVAQILVIYAIAILLMRGITNKKVAPDLLISLAVGIVAMLIPCLIDNEIVGNVISFVISLAALMYAVKVRADIIEPKPITLEEDSFAQTVAASREVSADEKSTEEAEKPTESEEFNPYK